MNRFFRALLFWRRPKPSPRVDISTIVQKALSDTEKLRKLASNISARNSLLERTRDE